MGRCARVAAAVLLTMLAACGGDDDDSGGSGPDLISEPRCVDALDTGFTYNFVVGNTSLRANEITITVNGVDDSPPSQFGDYGIDADNANGTLPDSTTFELSWLS